MITLFLLFSISCHCVVSEVTSVNFIAVGFPKPDELRNFFEYFNISHNCRAHLNSSIHYFRCGNPTISTNNLSHILHRIPWIQSFEHQPAIYVQKKAPKYISSSSPHQRIELENDEEYALAIKKRAELLRNELNFNDPHANEMWQFLNDGSEKFGGSPGLDINLYPVYKANITGRGAVAIIVDDALDTTHEDLRQNIRLNFTDDLLNSTRKDARGTDEVMKKGDDHGTEVAGLIAGVANNSKCAFGVAYNATLGGIRLLGEKVTDFMIGEALVRFSKEANMYISSWGPDDDGRTMQSPRKYMDMALNKTTHHGNHGRGAVFLFPSGNGGDSLDNCGADGFVNHPYVVAVNAIGEDGLPPIYSERCSAISITVPIGGAPDKKTFNLKKARRQFIVPTTSINNHCTKNFVGTSASNPMVGGVIALALEANANLTSRDINAILSLSGRIPVAAATDWSINGAGMLVSHTYGAGLLNAVRMVNLARHWRHVGPQRSCQQRRGEKWDAEETKSMKVSRLFEHYTYVKKIYPQRTTSFHFNVSSRDCPVEALEMVRVEMQWAHEHRGDLDVWLYSPSGQAANLLAPRQRDNFSGSSEMIWKSLLHIGEKSHGVWVVTITDVGLRFNNHKHSQTEDRASGFVRTVGLQMLGTWDKDSAFKRNYEAIIKHWTPMQKKVNKNGRAIELSKEFVYKLYDWQRWNALHEDVED